MWIEGKDSDGWNSNYFVLLRYARCLSVHQKSVSIVNIVNRLIGYNRKLISLSFKENLLLYSWSTFLLVVCSSLTKDLVFLRFVIRSLFVVHYSFVVIKENFVIKNTNFTTKHVSIIFFNYILKFTLLPEKQKSSVQ